MWFSFLYLIAKTIINAKAITVRIMLTNIDKIKRFNNIPSIIKPPHFLCNTGGGNHILLSLIFFCYYIIIIIKSQ